MRVSAIGRRTGALASTDARAPIVHELRIRLEQRALLVELPRVRIRAPEPADRPLLATDADARLHVSHRALGVAVGLELEHVVADAGAVARAVLVGDAGVVVVRSTGAALR